MSKINNNTSIWKCKLVHTVTRTVILMHMPTISDSFNESAASVFELSYAKFTEELLISPVKNKAINLYFLSLPSKFSQQRDKEETRTLMNSNVYCGYPFLANISFFLFGITKRSAKKSGKINPPHNGYSGHVMCPLCSWPSDILGRHDHGQLKTSQDIPENAQEVFSCLKSSSIALAVSL